MGENLSFKIYLDLFSENKIHRYAKGKFLWMKLKKILLAKIQSLINLK